MNRKSKKNLRIFSTIEEYIHFTKGTYLIKKILVANNGIAAIKFIRSIKIWSYNTFNNEKMIKFVSMVSPEDLLANAEFIRQYR